MDTDPNEQEALLLEALALKVELTVSKMKSEGKEEASREDAEVTILADLQSKQDQEAEHMMKDLAEKVRTSD